MAREEICEARKFYQYYYIQSNNTVLAHISKMSSNLEKKLLKAEAALMQRKRELCKAIEDKNTNSIKFLRTYVIMLQREIKKLQAGD